MATAEQLYHKFGPQLIDAVARVTMDEINIVRAQVGLPPRTLQQVVNAISAKLDSIPPYPWQDDG